MALLEILLKPLLNAQKEVGREEGIEIGEARANAEMEAWKERQLAAGVRFVEIDDDSDENPSSSDQ